MQLRLFELPEEPKLPPPVPAPDREPTRDELLEEFRLRREPLLLWSIRGNDANHRRQWHSACRARTLAGAERCVEAMDMPPWVTTASVRLSNVVDDPFFEEAILCGDLHATGDDAGRSGMELFREAISANTSWGRLIRVGRLR